MGWFRSSKKKKSLSEKLKREPEEFRAETDRPELHQPPLKYWPFTPLDNYHEPQQADQTRSSGVTNPYTNRITFDRYLRNGTGSFAADYGRDFDITVKYNENKTNERQPSHRIYRTTEQGRLHDIGALWAKTSERGAAYYYYNVKLFESEFNGFLWPVDDSETVWKFVKS